MPIFIELFADEASTMPQMICSRSSAEQATRFDWSQTQSVLYDPLMAPVQDLIQATETAVELSYSLAILVPASPM